MDAVVGNAGHADITKIELYNTGLIVTQIDKNSFTGDLTLIARYWDRSSEKTLRNLVREYGLADDLEKARRNK